MLLINNNWEKAESLEDVARIINEYYNPELAKVLDSISSAMENRNELTLEYKDDRISELKDTISYLEEKIEKLEIDKFEAA